MVDVYKRYANLLFFKMMCVCVDIPIGPNMKESLLEYTNNTKIRLIQSASNSYVGLNPFISFYCPSRAIFVTILV